MGENSIINISESRVNDWESERSSVVRDFSLVKKEPKCEIAYIAIGVDRRDNDKDRGSTFVSLENLRGNRALKTETRDRRIEEVRRDNLHKIRRERASNLSENPREIIVRGKETEGPRQAREKSEHVRNKPVNKGEEEDEPSKRLKNLRTVTSRSRIFPSSAFSFCPGLIQRIFLLFLSLLATPFSFSFSSCQQFSSTGSRGPALVSGSFFALVSLLVVVLLRPAMAIPAVATVPSDASASGGTSTSTTNPTFNDTSPTLPRIMQSRRNSAVIDQENDEYDDDEQVRDYVVLNFESVATTMKVPRRRNVEYTARVQSSNQDEKEEEEDEEEYYVEEEEEAEDDDEQAEEDAFPASLIPHTRESGHEMRSRLHEAELETIRRSIVEGLGLERIPDPSKANVSQTEYRRAHQEYLTRLQHSRDSGDGRQRRLHTFHPAERSPLTIVDRTRRSISSDIENPESSQSSSKRKSAVLYFPMAIPDEDFQVEHASLRLLLDPTDTTIEMSDHVVALYRIAEPNSRELMTRVILSSYKDRGPRWIEIDATSLADLWQQEETENLGVELIFESLEGPMKKQPLVSHPALNIFTTTYPLSQDFRGFRRKRRANPERLMSLHKGRRTECRGENKKCCRHEMTVIFKDLKGFEFIIQPKNFDAGYCKGRCPPRYNPAHHHALLQSLIWKEDRRKAPRPCCAPSKLDELEILYFDENDPTKLKVSSWKNMKVLECACS